jgi:hypothetical protein
MIERFLKWLEDGAYNAILRGVRRAITDVSQGELDPDPPKLEPPAKRRSAKKKS